jgi:thioredoxin 1
MHVKPLTSATFDAELRATRTPAVVDFYATWCPPCRILAPTLDRLATELAGRVAFFKVNIDEAPDLADRFGVQAVPTLAVFVGGRQVQELKGLLPAPQLRAYLERVAEAAAA